MDCSLPLDQWTAQLSCGMLRWVRSIPLSKDMRGSWSPCISTQTETLSSLAHLIKLPSFGMQESVNRCTSWLATKRKSPVHNSNSLDNIVQLHPSTAPVACGTSEWASASRFSLDTAMKCLIFLSTPLERNWQQPVLTLPAKFTVSLKLNASSLSKVLSLSFRPRQRCLKGHIQPSGNKDPDCWFRPNRKTVGQWYWRVVAAAIGAFWWDLFLFF